MKWSCAVTWLMFALSGFVAAQLPPEPSPVPELRGLLRSKDAEVRRAAAERLGGVSRLANGLPGLATANELLALFAEDPALPVCESAALALSELGTWPLGAFEHAEANLDRWRDAGADPATIDRVRAALASADKAWPGTALVPPLVELLRVQPCVPSVLGVLAALGEDAIAAGPAIDALLTDTHPSVRWRAAFTMFRLGVTDTPALRRAVADEDPPLRLWALRARLAQMQPDPTLAQHLVPWLADSRPPVRRWALETAAMMGPSAGPLVEALGKQLLDPLWRFEALRVLDRLGQNGAPVVPVLLPFLDSSELRSEVVDVLGRIGPSAVDATDALLRFATAPASSSVSDYSLAIGAVYALARIAPERILAALLPGVEHPQLVTHDKHMGLFGALGAAAGPALPRLQAMLDGDAIRRVRGLRAIRTMGELALPALPDVLRLLASDDGSVQYEALQVVAAIGERAAATAIPALERLYDNATEDLRTGIVLILHRLGVAAEALLVRAVSADTERTRFIATSDLLKLPTLSEAAQGAVLAWLETVDALTASAVFSGAYGMPRSPTQTTVLRTLVARTNSAPLRKLGLEWLWESRVSSLALPTHDYDSQSCFRTLLEWANLADRSGVDWRRLMEPSVTAAWATSLATIPDSNPRAAACTVLGLVNTTDDSRRQLAKLAVDESPWVRRAAVRALGRHGRAARDQLPVLAKALRDPEWFVRANAAEALRTVHRE